jgi:D-sedoheptulose 7-phosphate isomerase
MTMKDYSIFYLRGLQLLLETCLNDNCFVDSIELVANVCTNALKQGHRILLAGNGGSAADAQHIAAELVSKFLFDRPGLPAISLTTNASILTAIGNDYGYDLVFQRQIEALGQQGDVFIGISTSGNSINILNSLEYAKKNGLITVGFSGSCGKIQSICDYVIAIPSDFTPHIQEMHITVGHLICAIIEKTLFENKTVTTL